MVSLSGCWTEPVEFLFLGLRKLLHEAEFQVWNCKEYYCHAGKSHVILPQAPGTHVNALTFKILVSSTPPTDKYKQIYKRCLF